MIIATKLKSKQDRSIPEVVRLGMPVRIPKREEKGRLYENFAESTDEAVKFKNGLRHFCNVTVGKDFDVKPPILKAVSGDYHDVLSVAVELFEQFRFKTAEGFTQVLDEAVMEQLIGTIEWPSDDTCEFSYVDEIQTSKGFFRDQYRDLWIKHSLVNARKDRLPARHTIIPKNGRVAIDAMPPRLQENAWIVSGLMVVEDRALLRDRTELTALGRTVFGARDKAIGGAKSVGHFVADNRNGLGIATGVVAGLSLLALAIATAPLVVAGAAVGTATVGAVALDPALVVEKYVFAGWLD